MKSSAFYFKWALRVAIFIGLIYCLIMREWTSILGGVVIFLTTYLIDFINRKKPVIKDSLVSIYSVFCIFSFVIGVMFRVYNRVSWWDIAMHLFSGIVLAIVANELLDKLLGGKNTSGWVRFFFLVGFACLGGVVWEIYEFIVDGILPIDCQRVLATGVSDTMWDLITDLIGGVIGGVFFSMFDR